MKTKLLLPAVLFVFVSLGAVVATSGTSAQTPEPTTEPTVAPTATTTPVASPTTQAANLCAGTGIQVVAGGNNVTLGEITVTLPGTNNFAIGSTAAGGAQFLTVCELSTQATVTINAATGAVGVRSGTSAVIDTVIASVVVGDEEPSPPASEVSETISPPSTGNGGLR